MCLDFGDSYNSACTTDEVENSNKMKTAEEVADFEKEFRPDDVGKE